MGVNEIIDEYCQITGRPKFTITIDEFLKLKQVVDDTRNQKSPTQAINEQIVFAAKSQDLPSKKEKVCLSSSLCEKANTSEQEEKASSLEQNEKDIKVTPIFLKEEGLKKQELSPTINSMKQKQTSSALELLKSIKG